MQIEELTFTLSDVIQIAIGLFAAASAWFWLRGQFQRNTDRLARVETDLIDHSKNSTESIDKLGVKIDNLSETVVRIDTRGQVLEEKFAILATKG